ncbi:DUF3040 domain-containing protein [Arthrobacter cavernae]|uniref:DUF3040 domain-containing protein n=1 Tax=Arthrobacter cavernae TaxID=2817681 RepID=A0A939KNP6_9MICC|nr:DUF3040 domain-containing protein [Arthrobacter cavernae]MBO1269518.1 DUF3040 domain-containing protein [Arthrobacter cavernae]
MPLSEYERRRLQELENDLAADDPDLAQELRSGKPPRRSVRRIVGTTAVLAGLGMVIMGIAAQLAGLGILGFLLMVAATYGFLGRQ